MDSYQKALQTMYGSVDAYVLRNVRYKDKEEVGIALMMSEAGCEHVDNYRVFPLHRKEEHFAVRNRGCCGSFDSQVKCRSGNIYWIGFNYGH